MSTGINAARTASTARPPSFMILHCSIASQLPSSGRGQSIGDYQVGAAALRCRCTCAACDRGKLVRYRCFPVRYPSPAANASRASAKSMPSIGTLLLLLPSGSPIPIAAMATPA